ncbi:radical SAM protein [uncultured Tateyamaria sp.]|uniref:radical SAM/SPASM domain-containing protein n=1 Tax=uncultured Tateyamaria sp. TaxID=455651 RepID=UPI002630B85E|nr:radical SAM protein [uncultured Tateyamaria sp.]
MPHSLTPDFYDFRSEYGIGSLEQLESFPKFVQIETVSGCNARCRMCSVHDWKRTKSAMSDGLFNKLVAELAEKKAWVEQVTLQMGGEPLLDRRLEDRVSALKRSGIRSVGFTTNASMLDEDRAKRLLEAGIDMIDFSIDGASAETFEAIRINLSYEEVCGNVLRFIALRNASDRRVQIRVRMVIQPENAHELDAFVAFWRNQLGPSDYVLGRFLNWWAGWREDLSEVPGALLHAKPSSAELNPLPCLAPFSTLVVLSDGRVPLCCLDYNADTPMGSVVEKSIESIWQGDNFGQVRAAHRARGRAAMPFCQNCHIFATDSGFDFPGIEKREERA